MRFQVYSPVENGSIHGVLQQNIIAHIPDSVGVMSTQVGIVPIWWTPDFQFKQWDVTHPYVLLDFMEPHGTPELYQEMWRYIYDHPPAIWFKRESEGVIGTTLPICFPAYLPIPPTVTRAEFEARPITVFNNWGYSHVARPQLHGDIFHGMNKGINVIDSYAELEARKDNLPPNCWVSIHTHHTARRPMEEVIRWQRLSKIAVSLPGNGKVCFRTTEAPVESIMALLDDGIKYAYEWRDGINCVRLDPNNVFDSLVAATKRDNLYETYVRSQETARLYYAPDFVRDWIVGSIIKRL